MNSKKRKESFVRPLLRLANTILLFIALPSTFIQAQGFECGTVPNPSASQLLSNGSPCIPLLLDDLRQGANDRDIEINVNIQVFVPTTNSNSSVWHNTAYTPSTYTSAVKLINDCNWRLANLNPTPQLNNVNSVSNSRIKLKLKGFYINPDDIAYNNINTNPNTQTTQCVYYDDPTAINIFFGGYSNDNFNSIYVSTIPATYPGNMIRFHPGVNYSGSIVWDNISYYGSTLAHEMGHVLGLNHSTGLHTTPNNSVPTGGEPYSYIQPSFGCCSLTSASDYVRETYLAFQPCGTQGGSNNLMSQNVACNEYLSPHQIAVMHYNIRTNMKQFLSASGYTDALTVNPALNYTVTSNELWTDDRYFGGNIIVKQGKTLTIQCAVAMTKGARIIVEKGAQLFIDGGKITNISGELWDGIEVCGDPTQPQTMSNPAYYYNTAGPALYQGVVRIFAGEISNATNGIKTYTTSSNGGVDWNSTGGIIICYNANFKNNVRDVEFMYYNSNQGSNVSKFINCNFKTTAALNTGVWPSTHVSLYEVNGVQFKGCLFENSYANYTFLNTSGPYDPGRGIHSADAIYFVDQIGGNPSVFKQLETGIKVENSNPLKVVTVKNSKFYDNISDGVYFKNMNNFTFEKNYVSTPYYYAGTGMYLNNCANYSVKTSTFTENTTVTNKGSVGIYAYNSKKGSHQIYNNSFSNFEQGISCIGDNSGYTNQIDGLKMNCNDFTLVTNKYDIAMFPYNQLATVKVIQGKVANVTSQSDLVRNRYGASSLCSTCENKWHVSGTSYRGIDHGTNSSPTGCVPTPQPQNSDIAVNIVSSGVFQSSSCDNNPGSLGGVSTTGTKTTAINNYLATLKENHSADNNLTFDIQATLGEKIAYYASDTIDANADSVIAIIESNLEFVRDADIMRIYAYIHKGDYTTAESLANELGENRASIKPLLLAIISQEQEDGKLITFNDPEAISYMTELAEIDTLDGYSASQAILRLADGIEFDEPRLHPEGTGSRASNPEPSTKSIRNYDKEQKFVKIYPNPVNSNLHVFVSTNEVSALKLEVRDLLGRTIFNTFINANSAQTVSLENLTNGVYLLSIKDDKGELLYQNKFVKQE